MASVCAIFLGMVIYKDVSLKQLLRILKTTIELTVMILIIIAAAMLYAWLLIKLRIPFVIAEGLIDLSSEPIMPIFAVIVRIIFFPTLTTFLPAMWNWQGNEN